MAVTGSERQRDAALAGECDGLVAAGWGGLPIIWIIHPLVLSSH